MSLTVDQLPSRLNGQVFTLALADLGLANATRLIETHLASATLTITGAVCDWPILRVTGNVSVPRLGTAAITLTFTTEHGTVNEVTGFRAEIELADWRLRTNSTDLDASLLGQYGFTEPRLLLLVTPGVIGHDADLAIGMSRRIQGAEGDRLVRFQGALPPGDAVSCTVEPEQGFPPIALAAFDALLQFVTGAPTLEPDKDVPRKNLVLTYVGFAFRTDPAEIQLVEVRVELNDSWQINEGMFRLSNLAAVISVGNPARKPLPVISIEGELTLGSVRLVASVELPEFELQFHLSEPVRLGDLLQNLLNDPNLPGNLTVDVLDASVDVRSKEYWLNLQLAGPWKPVDEISLDLLELEITGAGTAMEGVLSGSTVITVGETELGLRVFANYERTTTGTRGPSRSLHAGAALTVLLGSDDEVVFTGELSTATGVGTMVAVTWQPNEGESVTLLDLITAFGLTPGAEAEPLLGVELTGASVNYRMRTQELLLALRTSIGEAVLVSVPES